MYIDGLNIGRFDGRQETGPGNRAHPALQPLSPSDRQPYSHPMRLRVAYAFLSLAALTSFAWGQPRATVVTDPGSNVTVTMAFVADTDLVGTIYGIDSDTAGVSGSALVTLFPAEPPFMYCTVHLMSMTIDTVELNYRVLVVITMQATLTDLMIESTEPFYGVIDDAGNVVFSSTPLRITGTAQLVSEALTLDEVIDIDAESIAPIAIHVSEDGGTLSWDQIVIPSTLWNVPPELLPSGISSMDVGVEVDTGGVVFHGALGLAMFGDTDADDDVDLGDLAALDFCLSGPGNPAIPYCGVLMFDDDDDVDLADVAEFQNAFTGSF